MPSMTISEAAITLGVSTDTVRRRVKRGEFQETQDARGRLCVNLDENIASIEVAGHAVAPQLAMEVSHLRTMLEHATQERDRAIDESIAWRNEAQRATGERGELIRALQQQQALQAAALGVKLITDDSGSVVSTMTSEGKRHWWKRG